ncbi:MAG: hypothetical protein QF903_12660 [Planctomycetota bacterium]|jgi:hypothetical protein|nr:hypothetical protein [Planctomycetota bacterium]MDP6762299.1 hypothetical protein [Planctomycetota bacterium]MDP6990313.1 hypothetical protein [Planctomycetota bacterium]
MAGARTQRRRTRDPGWVPLADEQLLDVRMCDLGLSLDGALQERVAQLHEELARAGLRFRPYVWLSTDWFTPDGSTGFAVPFYLAHRRLARLERAQMLEVEGGTHESCMKLLRHEAGHALDNAYRLHWRKAWRETFGRFSDPYRNTYTPRPDSRRHVVNLDFWYSQSHPAEDYAETFAVWLDPNSRWRERYEGWPALEKLERLDGMLTEIASLPARVRTRRRTDTLPSLRITLREYYAEKQSAYLDKDPSIYDHYLERVFSADAAYGRRETAASFLRRNRRSLRRRVSNLTGKHAYLADQVLNEMIARSRELGLRVVGLERGTRADAAVLVTFLTSNLLHGGTQRYRR